MVEIYDNFFNTKKCADIYSTILKSHYIIGWEDSDEPQHRAYPNLHSPYSFDDVKNLKIINDVLDKLKDKNITIDNYDKCMVNLTKPLDVNFMHCHPGQIVFIHYSCLTWNPEWGGETIFYKDDKKSVLKCNNYVPNRAVIFDGEIPHTIKAQNIVGPSYRFTLSLFFNKQ
tara:strand:- start:51 stop:563 length:513 start_codon:yes stop_codon:yes gene_type:complete